MNSVYWCRNAEDFKETFKELLTNFEIEAAIIHQNDDEFFKIKSRTLTIKLTAFEKENK